MANEDLAPFRLPIENNDPYKSMDFFKSLDKCKEITERLAFLQGPNAMETPKYWIEMGNNYCTKFLAQLVKDAREITRGFPK